MSDLITNMYGDSTTRMVETLVQLQELSDLLYAKLSYVNAGCTQMDGLVDNWSKINPDIAGVWASDKAAIIANLHALSSQLTKSTFVLDDAMDTLITFDNEEYKIGGTD